MTDEPKEIDAAIDSKVDEAFASREESKPEETQGEETPVESSTDETTPESEPEGGAEPQPDTESKEKDFEGVDKGFANHPAWQKREQKLKEANEKLEAAERRSKQFDELLGDPIAFKQHLRRQGYTAEEIAQEFRTKGLTDPSAPKATQREVYEIACDKLGWDIKSLNDEQKAYLRDQARLSETIADELIGRRVKPLEDKLSELSTREESKSALNDGFREVEKRAKDEFPDIDQKEISQAMNVCLDHIKASNPKLFQTIDPVELYEKATRQLLIERGKKKESQEVRGELKKSARPLRPGASTPKSDPKLRGKTVEETADKWMDEHGFNE